MISGAVLNYILGFATTISFMMNLGSSADISDLLASSTGQPWVALFLRITKSRPATIVLVVLMIFMFFFCTVNTSTAVSRQVWSFAQDKGLPFHAFLSTVHPASGVPRNAVAVTLVITCLVSLIIIGSPLAFNIILSVPAAGLLCSYWIVIVCLLRKKLLKEPLPASKFNLGQAGILINCGGIAFCSIAFFFIFWPAAPNPSPETMNWAIVLFCAVLFLAGGYYFVKARKEFDGPVVSLNVFEKWLCLTNSSALIGICAPGRALMKSMMKGSYYRHKMLIYSALKYSVNALAASLNFPPSIKIKCPCGLTPSSVNALLASAAPSSSSVSNP